MANASLKKQAAANTAALKTLHTVSVVICTLTAVSHWVFSRSFRPFVLLNMPALAVEYFLDKTGRPQYMNGQLSRSGSNLSQPGLTEYLHDIIYATWVCDILSILLGNRAFYLLLLVPVFAVYKGFQLLLMGKKLLTGK